MILKCIMFKIWTKTLKPWVMKKKYKQGWHLMPMKSVNNCWERWGGKGVGAGGFGGGGGGLKLLQWPASLLSCRNLQFIHYHSLILMAQLTLNYQHLFLANTSILASLQKFTIYPLPWSHSNGSADNYQHLFLANSSDLYQTRSKKDQAIIPEMTTFKWTETDGKSLLLHILQFKRAV